MKPFLLFLIVLLANLFVYSTTPISLNKSAFNSKDCRYTPDAGIAQDSIYYKIIPVGNNTYGYNIYKNQKLIVHQPFIPGRAGKKGFSKIEDAQKVASLVIRKIKKGEMPPTILPLEMKELGISD